MIEVEKRPPVSQPILLCNPEAQYTFSSLRLDPQNLLVSIQREAASNVRSTDHRPTYASDLPNVINDVAKTMRGGGLWSQPVP